VSGIALSSAVPVPRVDISAGGGASDTQVNPTPAFASNVFENDGDVLSVNTVGPSDVGDWVSPKAAAPGAYEIMAHQNSGAALDAGSSALDTWLALTSTRSWFQTQTGVGNKSANLTISIRLGSTVLSSGTFTLSATVG
jgi:hypothetical protein